MTLHIPLDRCWANSKPYTWCTGKCDPDPDGIGLCPKCLERLRTDEDRTAVV